MAQKAHFKQRMLERFDIVVNRHDIRHLVEDIRAGNNILYSDKLSCRLTEYTMIFMGIRCNILYDRTRGVPVTAKTMDMVSVSYSGREDVGEMFK